MIDKETSEPQDKIINLTELPAGDLCQLVDETIEQTLQQKATAIIGRLQLLEHLRKTGKSETMISETLEALVRDANANVNMIKGLRNTLSHPEAATLRTDYNFEGRQPSQTDKQYTSDKLQPKDIIDLK